MDTDREVKVLFGSTHLYRHCVALGYLTSIWAKDM